MSVRAAYEVTLRRQSAREAAARTYARALPIVPVRARGMTVEDADGRRYLDCLSGAGALALGHNHPVVLEAIRGVLDSGAPLHALDLATPVQDAFVAELLRTLPPGLAGQARVRFCGPGEDDAVQAAFRLVRAATGRTDVLAFHDARHGLGADATALSGEPDDAHAVRLPYPQDYRCPFGIGGPRGAELAARWAESALDTPGSDGRRPAGMILEAIQGESGVLRAPDAWMRRMREATTARSIPLIADEVQTGVGRTGAFWAVEHSGVTPDIMVLSRAIGGSLPLAVLIHRDALDVWPPDAPADTFRGNQLAMAAGTATLTYVRENRLAARAAALGTGMLHQLRALEQEFFCVGEVRGQGLMIGVEFVEPGESVGAGEFVGPGEFVAPEFTGFVEARSGENRAVTAEAVAYDGPGPAAPKPADDLPRPTAARSPQPPAPGIAAVVRRECLRRGLIVDLGGPHMNVVRLLPPLTISDEQATAVLDRLADAIRTAARAHIGRTVGSRRPQGARFEHRRLDERAKRAMRRGG